MTQWNNFRPLRERRDFLALKAAPKVQTRGFLLQGHVRPLAPSLSDPVDESALPEVGFILTKRIGNAVKRNRMRRRLREVLRQHCADILRTNMQYVFLCRTALLTSSQEDLIQSVRRALAQCHDLCDTKAPQNNTKSG